jgi:hypothetical protein
MPRQPINQNRQQPLANLLAVICRGNSLSFSQELQMRLEKLMGLGALVFYGVEVEVAKSMVESGGGDLIDRLAAVLRDNQSKTFPEIAEAVKGACHGVTLEHDPQFVAIKLDAPAVEMIFTGQAQQLLADATAAAAAAPTSDTEPAVEPPAPGTVVPSTPAPPQFVATPPEPVAEPPAAEPAATEPPAVVQPVAEASAPPIDLPKPEPEKPAETVPAVEPPKPVDPPAQPATAEPAPEIDKPADAQAADTPSTTQPAAAPAADVPAASAESASEQPAAPAAAEKQPEATPSAVAEEAPAKSDDAPAPVVTPVPLVDVSTDSVPTDSTAKPADDSATQK